MSAQSVVVVADKRAERGVRAESETAAVATAHGPRAEPEAEETDGPDQPDHDRGSAAVPGHGVPARDPGPAQWHTGQVLLPHVLQPFRRADGHAGAAERLAELRVLLLHEQAVPGGVRTAVPGAAQRAVQAKRHTGDVCIGLGRGVTTGRPPFDPVRAESPVSRVTGTEISFSIETFRLRSGFTFLFF